MPLSRSNPISIEVLQAAPQKDPKALEAEIEGLVRSIERVDADNIGWLRKQATLVRLRNGNRRRRNTPWKGAANVSVPLTDGLIRRWKPGVAALVLDADPVAFFTPQSEEDFDVARLVEPFFTYLFREAMNTDKKVVQLVDTIAWRGHAYTREAWCYRTQRQARIVTVDHIFPEGVQEAIEQGMQAALAQGQQISPEQIVMARLAEEYFLSIKAPGEGEALALAAEQIINGAEFVKLVYRHVVEDRPDWQPIDPINVIVPQDEDPENATFFTIIHQMNADQLRAMAVDGHLGQERVELVIRGDEKIDTGVGSAKNADGERQHIRDLMDRKAGLATSRATEQNDSGVHTIWEIYCKLDVDGTGERQRCILWYAPNSRMELGLLDYPYPFDDWPITYFAFEAARRPVDNRGLADMTRTQQQLANTWENARIDAAQIVLAPVIVSRVTEGINRQINWRPGGVIKVQDPGDVQILQKGAEGFNIINGLLQEQQVVQRQAETYVGVFDATLTNIQQSRERRTAAEVNAITNLSGSIFGLDARIFSNALSKSFQKVWQLYEDFGPAEMFFRVTGEEQPRVARKREIVRNYDIRAAGTPANTNKALQIQNLERVMQIMLNPLVLNSGIVNIAELFTDWAKLVDYNLSKRIIRDPEEAAAIQQVLQAAQIANGGQQVGL